MKKYTIKEQLLARNTITKKDADKIIDAKVEILWKNRKFENNDSDVFLNPYYIFEFHTRFSGNKEDIKKQLKKFYREYLKHSEINSIISFLKLFDDMVRNNGAVRIRG